ncbi:enoyl-CoA hydratase-related protein [Flavihumibacter rivuli]|uniref:enoyl-CoA hydratase/isomerase family protein n=1 Tax=Flavihumibacter rivuli TaxID=2838156 RepID=UPI001BDEFEFC|nr:enoyl-CoA hydratase-related protein [Flavihumibacter rivuli]ULQ54966.1 enoyl-CoA hydratase-related protein [Flavihumibacter rivuli]
MYNTIFTSLEDGILTITINRPDKLNALNKDVIDELGKAIAEVYTNREIRAAIITGAGPKSFVAGADISEFLELNGEGGKALAQKGHDLVFNKIENSPKPIVAAINGFALGGGCELAMACHFRLAADHAKFGQPEVNLGLIPGYGGTQRLTQLVGKGKAIELMMTGAMIDANTALQLGLVNHVTAPEDLLPKTREIMKTILGKAPIAIAKVIELTNIAAKSDPTGLQKEVDAFGLLFETEDAKEGAKAFLEKRKPEFKGN